MDFIPTIVMIIYNSTWSIIQRIWLMMVRRQSYLVNSKESVVHICDKPYHTNNRKVHKVEAFEGLGNCAF